MSWNPEGCYSFSLFFFLPFLLCLVDLQLPCYMFKSRDYGTLPLVIFTFWLYNHLALYLAHFRHLMNVAINISAWMALIMYSQFLVLYLACMHSLCHLVIQSKRKTHSLRITAPGVEDAKEESNTVAVLRTHTTYNRLVLLCLRKPWVTKPLNWRMTRVCRIDTPDSSDVLVSFALPWYSGGHSVPYTWVFCLCNSNWSVMG